MNKKSFLLGVFVGVLVTWALSFYLYYSLNQSQNSQLSNLQKNIFNFDDSDENDSENGSEQKHSNSLGVKHDKSVDGKTSYFKNKLKNESKRKISRKLVEELQPVVEQDDEFGIIKSLDDQLTRDNGYKTHAFNVLVSNHIGSYRIIPDTRHKV